MQASASADLKRPHEPHRGLYIAIHLVMLALSIYLVVSISIDTFKKSDFTLASWFVRQQFWICMVFLADFFLELILSKRKGHFVLTHLVFFLVSVPWLELIELAHVDISSQGYYWVRFIPLIRGGYALAIVIGWFTYNSATRLFVTYIFTIVASIYFASLIGYTYEHPVNKAMSDYQNAIWWAAMNFTTVGSNIVAVTPIGRILSVAMACMGMMMLPVFTIYITSQIQRGRSSSALNDLAVIREDLSGEEQPGSAAPPAAQGEQH